MAGFPGNRDSSNLEAGLLPGMKLQEEIDHVGLRTKDTEGRRRQCFCCFVQFGTVHAVDMTASQARAPQ